PHPHRAPVTFPHRRAQVSWRRVFSAADRALVQAPEWEEAHHVYGDALAQSGWASDPDEMIVRRRRAQAGRAAGRGGELAGTPPPASGRSGRAEALAEAWRGLGSAPPSAAAPAPVPAIPLSARFGRELELTGLDLPAVARPGETVQLGYHWRAISQVA